MHLQVQLRVPHQFHLLLNYFVHSYALTIAWKSATYMQPEVHLLVQPQVQLFEHIYIDLEVHLWVQFQLYCQVHHKFYYQACLKRIFRIYSLKSIIESMFKCFPYALSFATPVISGGVICDFLV